MKQSTGGVWKVVWGALNTVTYHIDTRNTPASPKSMNSIIFKFISFVFR